MNTQEPLGTAPQQAPPYQQPAYPAQYPAPKQRNVVGIIAFIIAIVGFIFACVPGALIVGWVLLPIAFVLSLVSLFLRDKSKGLGITALIISVVGTVVGFVVFFAIVISSFDAAFHEETSIQAPTEQGSEQAAPAAQDDTAAADGTRENPAPIGSTISSSDWTVVVNGYNPSANQIVAESNQFNEEPAPGTHFEIVTYTVTYNGADSAYAMHVDVDLVTSSGNVINSYDAPVVLNDSMALDELFTGASATGSLTFQVPDGESVLIRVRPGMLAHDVFVRP